MKTPKDLPPDHDCLAAAKLHFAAAGAALRKGCAEALLTGINLIALHGESNAGHGGVRLAGETSGFKAALEEIGIQERTAYRWMNACASALIRAGIISEAQEVAEKLPNPGSKEWAKWETKLQAAAEGMSLNRLLLGCSAGNSDEQRHDELITRSENGDNEAAAVLEKIANGDFTLVQAMRAAAGALATKGKERKDPVYLDFDPVSKRPIGLLPKAFVTLHNGFVNWDSYDVDARDGLRTMWKEIIKATPRELAEMLRK